MNDDLAKSLLLGRLLAFMLLFYVGFGLLVEWRSSAPQSKLKAFARLLCRPLVAPIQAMSPAGTPYRTLLVRTGIAVVAVWLALVLASEVALRP
jgi:hypothetical protein